MILSIYCIFANENCLSNISNFFIYYEKTTIIFFICFAACKANAYPIVIHTSCGSHMTDTDLWGDMTEAEIKAELETLCSQEQEGED